MKRLSLLRFFLSGVLAVIFFLNCGNTDKDQSEVKSENAKKTDETALLVEKTLDEVRKLEKENNFESYLQARDLIFILTDKTPAFVLREEVLYELVKVHCLHLKSVLNSEDIINKRTLTQLDYGYMIYTFAKGYTDFYPSGQHCPLMQKIVSYWKEPPEPLPKEIEKKPFNPGEFNQERFMHGLKNLGGTELLNFLKTYDW